MPLFSRFKSRGHSAANKNKAQDANQAPPPKPRFQSNWNSPTVVPDEVEELIRCCTAEIKTRAESLDAPLFLLPFRPGVDASSARTFILNFFRSNAEGSDQYRGASLQRELRLTDPVVLCSIIKWVWSRVPGGVVSWTVYEAFRIGEKESNLARNAFNTFVPLGADSKARQNIIVDFFDLLSAIAAHGKLNGLGGRKLSRLAGWWAFELSDEGNGFQGGYKSWSAAADACSHLFFAYLRSLSPEADPAMSMIERIPRSLQALLASTEYPPEPPAMMQKSTPRVVMVVDKVSPTPFALLRRAKHFEYRAQDTTLREYQEFEDPLDALTEECRRVLYQISATNSKAALSRHGEVAQSGEAWSAFQEMGFSDSLDTKVMSSPKPAPTLPPPSLVGAPSFIESVESPSRNGMGSSPRSWGADIARPTTPSWADFLSSGFADDDVKTPTGLSLPSEKYLPPLPLSASRAQTPAVPEDTDLQPGELAAITNVELDDAFWWVWMTSLASEEHAEKKSVFGRCALIETNIRNGQWLIMEEQIKGAVEDPVKDAYVAPKKSFFSFSKRGRLGRKRSTSQKLTSPSEHFERQSTAISTRKGQLGAAQESKIKAAAAALAAGKPPGQALGANERRGRTDESATANSNNVLAAPVLSEATPAMQWAKAYDKQAIRAQYLGDAFAGKGMSREELVKRSSAVNLNGAHDREDNLEIPAGAGLPPIAIQPRRASAVPGAFSSSAPTGAKYGSLGEDDDERSEKQVVTDGQGSPRLSRKPVGGRESYPPPQDNGDDAAPSPDIARRPQPAPSNPAAAPAAAAAMNTNGSPDAKYRLQKQPSNSGGIKKLFGRKKDEPAAQARPEVNSLAAPAGNGLSRRLSDMRTSKNTPRKTVTPKTSSQAIDISPVSPEAAMASKAAMSQSPPRNNSNQEPVFNDTAANMFRATSHEREEDLAEREWSSFDQGIEHVRIDQQAGATKSPVAVAVAAPVPQRPFNTEMATRIAPELDPVSHEVSPVKEPADIHPDAHEDDHRRSMYNDAQSEATMDDQDETDRWAKIRENAAKRAAARASEERSTQSRHSHSARTEDDGETSGEETIESRVARIKARVAELTGGLEQGAGSGRR